jgi:ligand-binding sensor domain-containing protein
MNYFCIFFLRIRIINQTINHLFQELRSMRNLLFLCGIILFFVAFLTGCKKNTSNPPARGPVWLVFTKSTHTDIVDDNIHTIFASSDKVWFGTDSGALSYGSGVWSTIRDSLSYFTYGVGGTVKKQTVVAIAEGRNSSIWFGLDGGGLRRFNRYNPQRAWQRYSSNETDPINRIPSDFVTGVVADKFRNGDVWVTTLAGVAHYVPSSSIDGIWYPYSDYSEHFTSSLVRSVILNPSNGWIFFGTHDGMPYVYDDNGLRWGKYNLPESPIHSIAVDYSNTVWMGKTFGVTRWSPASTQSINYDASNTNNKLPNQKINAIAVDFFQPIRWFGTDYGLTHLRDTTWTFFDQTTTPELPSNQIQALAYDTKGNLWIGTNRGIVAYNPEGFEY